MELIEGLLRRRTIYSFKQEEVNSTIIDRALDCAIMAPNHKMTEPWHFYAVKGETKEKLAQRKKELKWEGFLDQDSERAKRAGESAYMYIVNLPWVIVVTTHRYSVDPVREKEDYAATCCAVQNFQLAAWAEGVGTKWSTGQLVKDQKVRDILGVGEEEEIVAVLYLGYPEDVPEQKKRNRTEIVNWLS
ncbi:nitroreductase [Salibacterium salarium]|uniref:Putative NAD(P)H nitroreductase n=1 Tax=Salibacterium salarium TaxID=284579 RepID=A0A3R9Q0P4_9BACI|nr:nitroreductase [Salibacterium salarium]RSL31127.1 nitroreductase [Salibacterium salarium]